MREERAMQFPIEDLCAVVVEPEEEA